MPRPVTEQQRRNQQQQQQLYGAPLVDLVGRAGESLSLSQGRIAGILGISAPMLSQLLSGHRVKIGNPSAVARLQRMLALADEVRAGTLEGQRAVALLSSESSGQVLTRTSQLTRRQGATEVQQLLRAIVSATEVLDAATLLEPDHPRLAEFLRVYGAGRSDEAVAHYERALGGSLGQT